MNKSKLLRDRTDSSVIKRSATNMYISVHNSLGPKAKGRLVSLKDLVQNDGPTAVYKLLRLYTGDTQPEIRHCQDRLNNLDLARFHYDVDEFSSSVDAIYSRLENSGGSDPHAALKVYEALQRRLTNEFNNTLGAWSAVQENTGGLMDLTTVLLNGKATYRSLKLQNRWFPKSKTATSKSTTGNNNKDITALEAQVENLRKALTGVSSNTNKKKRTTSRLVPNESVKKDYIP